MERKTKEAYSMVEGNLWDYNHDRQKCEDSLKYIYDRLNAVDVLKNKFHLYIETREDGTERYCLCLNVMPSELLPKIIVCELTMEEYEILRKVMES